MDYTYFPYAKRCKIEAPNEWERPPSTHALGGSEVDRGAMRPGSGTDIPQSEPAPTGHQYLPFHPAAPGNMFSSSPATPTLPHHNLGLTSATTPPIPHPPFPVNPLAPAAETKPFDQCMYNMHNFNGSSYCDPNYSSSMFSMPMYGGAPQWAAQRCDTGNVACAYGQNSFYDYRNMGHMANTDSQNMYFQQTGHPYMSRAMFEPVIKREADCTNIPPDRGRGPDNGAYSFSPTQHGMSPHAMTQHAALNQYHMAPQMHNIKSERMPMGYPHNQVSPHQSQSPNSMAETCVYHSLLEGDADADENPDRKTIYNFSCSDQANMADQYLLLEQQLCFRLRSLLFPEPVSHIYCPLDHAFEPHADYVRKYYHGRKEVMFLGMNPGPFGMVQNGVPFGEVEIVKDWLKVSGNVFKPRREHPQRPVLGMECKRSEVSGARFWGLLREICGDPETFFTHCFIHNHCPLAFMSVTGKNITPPKLPVGVRKALNEACDQALKEAMRLYGVKILVGVGKFAQERAKAVLNGEEWSSIRIETIMHPSPINPAANKGWNDIAKQQLRDIGVWQYLTPKSPCPAAPTDAPTNPAISAAPVPTSTPPAAPSLPNTPTLPSTPIPNTPPTNPPSLPPQC